MQTNSWVAAADSELAVASRDNNIPRMRDLLEKNIRVERPHEKNCRCEDCEYLLMNNELYLVTCRLEIYKAFGNPYYIFLTGLDPVLETMRMYKQLQEQASEELYFKEKYEELAAACADFLVEFLDHVESSVEMTYIVDKSREPGK